MFFVIVTFLFFGMLINMEFATDTYSVFNFNSKEIFMQYSMSGRFITAYIGKIIKITNISEYTIYIGSWIIAIFCAICSQYLLYKIIEKDVKYKSLKLLIPTLIIINPFSIELFLYIEKGIMWFGILTCILAIDSTILFLKSKYDEDKPKYRYIIYAMIFMFISNCSYQGIIGIFVSILLVYILKYSKNLKKFIYNNILVGLIYIIPTFINYLILKTLYLESRVNGKIMILDSIKKIVIDTAKMYINMFGILPKYLLIFLILFTFSVFCCKIFKKKERFLSLLKFFYLIVGITIISIIPQFVQPTESIWIVPRTTYCFASIYGILLLFIAQKFDLKKSEKSLIVIISSMLLLIQFQIFIQIEKDRYLLNKMDEQITMQIIHEIDRYEVQTKNRITEVCFYQDEHPNFTYSGITAIGDVNVKCYANGWSTVAILNYYLKRNLKLVNNNEEIAQNTFNKNWDEFNEEQIGFKHNKLILFNF